MNILRRTARALLSCVALSLTVHAAAATASPPQRCGPVDPSVNNAPYVMNYGLTPALLQTTYYGDNTKPNDGSHSDNGYRPVRLTGYVDGGQVRYATKWVKDGATWSSMFGLTGAQFHARYLEYKAKGFRIVDASGYVTPAGVRYADIWVKNTSGVGWAVTRDVTQAQMNAVEADMRNQGYAPIRIEGYRLGSANAFVIVWEKSGCAWQLEESLTSAQYQAFFDANVGAWYPVHVDGYLVDSQMRYASILHLRAGPPVRARHGNHWYLFQQAVNNGSCDGYVPDAFYVVEAIDGWETFGGIWNYRGVPAVTANSPVAARITHRVNCAEGRAGAAFVNIASNESVFVNGDQPFGSASASKVAILYGLLRKADAEDIDLDTTKVDGIALATLATDMIQNSSNSASNTLIDYVGRTQINDELAALGLQMFRLQRYLTGGPSAHGLGSWFDDFKAGYDNFVTPRELATLYRLVYANNALLSASSYQRFFDITDLAPTLMDDALPAGYVPNWMTTFNKPGGKSYPGVVGDFAHRPQLAAHKVAAEGGMMVFGNGQRVFYAVIVDQAELAASVSAIACTGWEAARTWAADGSDEGNGLGFCDYP